MPVTSPLIRPLDRDELRERFRSAEPFPFVCLDDFLDPDFAKAVAAAYPDYAGARKQGKTFYGVNEMRKVQINDEERFPEPVRRLAQALVDPAWLELLAHASGIDGLSGDPDWRGGGMHLMARDAHLDVHVDFNVTKQERYRRLNVLCFLNEGWQREWGGCLELWNADVSERVHEIVPLMNRCVIFETSEVSYHGVTRLRCPEGRLRRSFAGYYYTDEAPPGYDGVVHGTTFRARPDEKLKGRVLMPLQSAAHKVYKRVFRGDDA